MEELIKQIRLIKDFTSKGHIHLALWELENLEKMVEKLMRKEEVRDVS